MPARPRRPPSTVTRLDSTAVEQCINIEKFFELARLLRRGGPAAAGNPPGRTPLITPRVPICRRNRTPRPWRHECIQAIDSTKQNAPPGKNGVRARLGFDALTHEHVVPNSPMRGKLLLVINKL